MMQRLSVGQLYPYAMAEEEGVGTAYEYLAKRLVLAGWLGSAPLPQSVLVAGTPEKYGSSLDFALIAHEYGARLTVIDDREEALRKFERSVTAAQSAGLLADLAWETRMENDLGSWQPAESHYDLALSSEVLQRIGQANQRQYVAALWQTAERVALFCPNRDNRAHTGLSGLKGIQLEALNDLTDNWASRTGFIDMPPFPPGITRSDEQREQAVSGRLEGAAMAFLGIYARLERFVPGIVRRRQAHIVFALSKA